MTPNLCRPKLVRATLGARRLPPGSFDQEALAALTQNLLTAHRRHDQAGLRQRRFTNIPRCQSPGGRVDHLVVAQHTQDRIHCELLAAGGFDDAVGKRDSVDLVSGATRWCRCGLGCGDAQGNKHRPDLSSLWRWRCRGEQSRHPGSSLSRTGPAQLRRPEFGDP